MIDLKVREEKVLAYWKERSINSMVRARNKGRRKFYFLDGPPNAYGLAVHHLWVYAIKDLVLKYKRYRGFDVHDRPGFDVHGLPIENKIERKLNLKSKKEIEEMGVENFVKACRDYAESGIKGSIELLKRFGVFMDFDNTYVPYTSKYIDRGWQIFRRMYDKKLLYRGLKPLAYCPHCETVLSANGPEVEYKDAQDTSVFVRFKVAGKSSKIELSPDTYLVIWTTTPWTLPSNMAIAASPKAIYVVASVEGKDYIVAKDRLDVFTEAVGSTVVKNEFYGSELVGTKYESPLAEQVPIQKRFSKYHRVLSGEAIVSLGEGTGLLHIAPGHGPEDFAIAKANRIPAFSPIDQHARYTADAGKYAGLEVPVAANEAVLKDLRASGDILFEGQLVHSYPFCWRCGSKLIYRATDQFFINVGKIRKKMLSENKKIKWYPDFAQKWFADAVESSPDWCISRQRYWGAPIPLWICGACNAFEVMGSVKELETRAKLDAPLDDLHLHKPYIDRIELKCKCGGTMKRTPDLFDVWYESGIAHTASLTDEEFARLYPADWISESLDQIRGWFSTLLRTGVAANGRRPFNRVTIGGMMKDEIGEEMHRNKGNSVTPDDLMSIVSVDGFRLWCASRPRWQDLKLKKSELKDSDGEIIMLYNIAELAKELAGLSGYDTKEVKRPGVSKLELEDLYILSRLNSLISEFTERMDLYQVDDAINKLRAFMIEDFSRFYLKFAKQRAADASKGKLKRIACLASYILYNISIMVSVAAPLAAEHIFSELFSKDGGSVFMEDWPRPSKRLVNKQLEGKMQIARDAISAILNSRERAGVSLRWPISRAVVEVTGDDAYAALQELSGIVESYVNAKRLELKQVSGTRKEVVPLFAEIGPSFKGEAQAVAEALKGANAGEVLKAIETSGSYQLHTKNGMAEITSKHFTVVERAEAAESTVFRHGVAYIDKELSKELKDEALLREFERNVQMTRKELALTKMDSIELNYDTVGELARILPMNMKRVKRSLRATRVGTRLDQAALVKQFDIDGEIVKVSVKRI